MNKKHFLLIIFQVSFLYVFSNVSPLVISYDMETVQSGVPWTNTQTIIQGDAHSGNKFSRTDSLNLYGLGWKGSFPEIFQKKNTVITISCFIRMLGESGKASLVISILKKDSTIYWENRSIDNRVKIKEGWNKIEDEIKLPGNITSSDYTLLIYLWNENGRAVVDLDDLTFRYSEVELPSYLLPSDSGNVFVNSSDFVEEYSGKYFRMEYDKFSGQFRILSPNRRILCNSFSLYASWTEQNKNSRSDFEEFSHKFYMRKDSLTEEGKYFIFDIRSDLADTRLLLFFSSVEPVLTFSTSSIFKKSVDLKRLSLSANYVPDLSEVYKSTSFVETVDFQTEYWLGHSGFQVFSDSAGFIIYHPEKVSSLQLNPIDKKFTVNIDWELDHPLLHWPLLEKSENFKENFSTSVLSKGSELSCSFNLQGIRNKRKVPLIMRFPEGRTAALIWTEHADFSDLKLQRAVNFGSDEIETAENARAGFVMNKIPVTKSVFYANPDKVMNTEKAGFVASEIANIKSSTGFKEFLLDLQNQGQEICLHTPEQYTTTKPLLKEALDSMKRYFNSRTWIDHGYDNARKSNREDLVCDGLLKKSEYSCRNLWNEYGIEYFWNCFYEDSSLYSPYSFNSFLSLPYSGWGDRFPVPGYWRHESRSENIVHWRTTGTLDPPDGSMWNYFFNATRLNDLLQSHGTSVLHVYPARADSSNGFYEYKDGHYIIQDSFEDALKRQAALRDAGRLQLVTIGSYIDFQVALENIDMTFLTSSKVRIENKGSQNIRGLTFMINSAIPGVRGKNIKSRQEDGQTYYWFDLNKGESILMDLLEY